MKSPHKLKQQLDRLVEQYENSAFVEHDPIQVPHRFVRKEDIEIAAFITAVLSWGQRPAIIKNATRLIQLMDNAPYEFLQTCKPHHWQRFENFTHRTFNGSDCIHFLQALSQIYKQQNSLEQIFTEGYRLHGTIAGAIGHFRKVFIALGLPARTQKHIANIERHSAAKRLNMFLRWMVRSNRKGVDFGLWRHIPPSALMIPLDVHASASARKLKLLTRKTIDWQAVEEVTRHLRLLDPADPIKYDFALFGLSANNT